MKTRPYRPEDEDAVIALMAEHPDFVETPTDRVVLRLDHRVQLVGSEDDRVAAYASLLCPPWFDAGQLSARIASPRGLPDRVPRRRAESRTR